MKEGKNVAYFDSYGDATLHLELQRYLGNIIKYTTDNIQTYSDPPVCGHLCLEAIRLLLIRTDIHKVSQLIKNEYGWLQWFYF